ncbi:MAG TPA: PhzF family phenazine biosynthesis protein [Gemmatimonadales bacterium]|jgi:trans-2,3-dihydro-3-hydroxyanthranilate isomerase|nr:PhzF family phenazine biosynthesis protein [Gemmatimonadales bacterium]
MKYRFCVCDVFTDTRFGGNPLAVLPEASGLSDRQMQQVAMEFGFSESTFVLPPEAGNTRRVRIFTPSREIPFAGHPNVGTAFVLATTGGFGPLGSTLTVTFEEKAGLVPIVIQKRDGNLWCELQAPERLSVGKAISERILASAVALHSEDVLTTAHEPLVASAGLPFVIAELRDLDALARARPNMDGFDALEALAVPPDVLLYVRMTEASPLPIRARMFAPGDRVAEDPATGSANCALAGLLSHLDPANDGDFSFQITQGVEMGRPSLLEARTEKRGGEVVGVWIGGTSVMVSEGWIEV